MIRGSCIPPSSGAGGSSIPASCGSCWGPGRPLTQLQIQTFVERKEKIEKDYMAYIDYTAYIDYVDYMDIHYMDYMNGT